MADPDYGDVSAVQSNLAALFPSGLTETTKPAEAEVASQVARFRAQVRQVLKLRLGTLPKRTSDAGRVASATVEAGATAWAMSVALAGRRQGKDDVKRWQTEFEEGMKTLRGMSDEFSETPALSPRVRHDSVANRRDPRLTDEQLSGEQAAW